MTNSYTLDPTKPYAPPQSFAAGGIVDDSDQGADGNIDTGNGYEGALNVVDQAMDFGRQANGIGGQQTAANIPAQPAGPGGDQPGNNPFPTKTPAIPFGQRDPNKPMPIQNFGPGGTMFPASGYDAGGSVMPARPAGPGGDRPDDNPFPTKTAPVPFGKRYDDGGPVDDNQQTGMPDNMPAPPQDNTQPAQQNTAPANNVAPQAMPTGQDQEDQGPIAQAGMAPHQLLQQGASKILRYLTGADAAPPQQVQQLGQQVDPDGKMTEDERNLATVKAAGAQGGPQAAWQVVQANRQAFNAKQAFARAALNGTQGKPSDVAAAAKAATQAFPHMLDGTATTFTPAKDGVTATVTKLGQTKPFQQTQLTLAQFNDLLNMGKDGLYDNIMERGVGTVLQQLAQKPGTPPGQQGAGAQPTQPTAPFLSPGQAAPGATPPGAPNAPQQPDAIDPQIQRQANALFPRISQQDQRNAWIAQRMTAESEQQNKVEVAKNTHYYGNVATANALAQAAETTAVGKVSAAQIYTNGRVDVAKLQQQWRDQAGRNNIQAALIKAGAGALAAQIKNIPFGQPLPPQAEAAMTQALSNLQGGGTTPAPAAPAQAPMATQAPAQGKRPPPGWVKAPQ